MNQLNLCSDSLETTHQIGRQLGAALSCGHVVALIGPLGAGKTTLVKGVADGAGVADLRQVNSPTFVIVNEYEAGSVETHLRIYHIDAYRLLGAQDLEALGFDEMCTQGAAILEWADRVESLLPADRLNIEIVAIDDCKRHLTCIAGGRDSEYLLDCLAACCWTEPGCAG